MKFSLLAIVIAVFLCSCLTVSPIKGKYYEPSPVTFTTPSNNDAVWERFTDFIVDYGLQPQIIDPTSGLFFLNDCTFEATREKGKRNVTLVKPSAPFVSSSIVVGTDNSPRFKYVKADINLKIKRVSDNQTQIKIYLSDWQVYYIGDKISYWLPVTDDPSNIQSTRMIENLIFEKKNNLIKTSKQYESS